MFNKEITFDRFIRVMTIIVLLVLVFIVVKKLSGVLLPFFIAWFLAYLINPMVDFVQNRLHVKVRAIAVLSTMIVFFSVIFGVIYLIIPPMIEQFERLGVVATKYLHQTTQTNDLSAWVQEWLRNNQTEIENFFKSRDFAEALKTAMPKVFSVIGQTANVVLSIIASCIVLLYMFFILMDYDYLTKNWLRIFPEKNRPFWKELMQDVARELNNYIRGQGTVALLMGIMFCIGFTILDYPMAIGLGILIGIMDLVPYLHTFALIPTAFLAMLKCADTGQNFWVVFGLGVLLFIIVQIITDMIVTPKVMGKAMGLNPAILLLSLSVWGALLGFIGLIIALPLTTLIMAYWQRYVTREIPYDIGERQVESVETLPKEGEERVAPTAKEVEKNAE